MPASEPRPGHAVAAGIVDDDEIDAAGLLAFGGEPGAGAAADDRLAARRMARNRSRRSARANARHRLPRARRRRRRGRSAHGTRRRRRPRTRGSLMWRRTRMSCRLAGLPHGLFQRTNSAASASGSRNGWPGASSAETPPSGRKKRTGPSIRLSRSPIQRPIAAIFLRRGAHQRDLRVVDVQLAAPIALGGTVSSGAEIDHVERAAGADIGHPDADHGAEAVLGRRETPPISRSQTSVVVMSMTPASTPESTSFSIDWPPMPVAWNTRHS